MRSTKLMPPEPIEERYAVRAGLDVKPSFLRIQHGLKDDHAAEDKPSIW
jgi:hypothetical protein